MKICLFLVFLISIIGNGSSESQKIKTIFNLLEQICQGGFVVFLILELRSLEGESKILKLLDFLSIACSFAGIHTQGEVSRYFLALRVLKLTFLIKEFPALEEQTVQMKESLKLAGNIFLPVIVLILTYSIAGVHCFGGKHHLI